MSNIIKKIIKESIREYLTEESINQKYYRAIPNYEGIDVVFEPKGYYESFDDDGNPIFHTGNIMLKSDKPEIAASKTVGGSVLGAWSMFRTKGEIKNVVYIYEINTKPYKDLSNVSIDDFYWLKEVRYNVPINGKYIGKFIYDKQFNDNAENFYNRFSDDYLDVEDVDIEKWENFEKYILTMDVHQLKK